MTPLCLAYALLLVTAPLTCAKAAEYRAVLLDLPLPDGITNSFVSTISKEGALVGSGFGPATGLKPHALFWDSSRTNVVDLHPAGYDSSYARGVSGDVQGGVGYFESGSSHALLWRGTAGSVVNLHPPGAGYSEVSRVSGNAQVGWGEYVVPGSPSVSHALLWHGTAESVVDLAPAGSANSRAYGVSEEYQVGYATSFQQVFSHATLWHGTAASAVDLHPTALGFPGSVAYAVSGEKQVGALENLPMDITHAVVWSGTAQSAVDLHPAGFKASTAVGILGDTQVGAALSGVFPSGSEFFTYAYVWNGTAASGVNLHPYVEALGQEFISSYALAVTEDGTIYGWAGTGMNVFQRVLHAVKWVPVVDPPRSFAVTIAGPEPAPGGGKQITLTWPSLPGDQFNLIASFTFESGSWEVIHSVTAQAEDTSLSTTVPLSELTPWKFYRIELISTAGE